MTNSVPTSPSLLEQVRDVTHPSWDTFVELYYPLIYHAARRAGLNREAAKDVTQGVFAGLVVTLREFTYDRGKGKFRGWLHTVARNAVVSWYRKNGRGPTDAAPGVLALLPDPDSWDEAYAERVRDWALDRAKAHFTPARLEAFRLVYCDGLSSREAAGRLGGETTEMAVAVACSNVKSFIVKLIQEEGVEL